MFKLNFWLDTIERSVKAGLGAVLTVYGVDGVNGGVLISSWDWVAIANLFGTAVVLNVALSIMSAPFGEHNTASLLSRR